MKKLALFSILAFVMIILTGCMDKDIPTPSQDTVQTGSMMDSSRDLNHDGINDCESDGTCDHTIDYSQPRSIANNEQSTGTIVGNDKDEHGCITSAGYTRNEAKQACTRSREDNQTKQPIVGNDKDEHGCIASAGYTRNEAKQACTRSF